MFFARLPHARLVCRLVIAVALAAWPFAGLATNTASAGTITTWSATGGNNNWSTPGNWTTTPTTSGTFSLVYRGNPSRTTSTNNTGPLAVKVDSILFANTGSTGSTSTFILSKSATSPALSLTDGATVATTAVTTGTLSDVISSAIAISGTGTFNVGSRHNLSLTGALSGGGSLVKTGSGELSLSGANGLAALKIDQGVTQFNPTSFAGVSGLTVDIGSSGQTGTLRTSAVGSAGSPASTNMQCRLNGNATITPNGSSNITFDASYFNAGDADGTTPVTLTLNGGYGIGGGTQTINGVIQNNSVTGTVNVTIGDEASQNVWVFNGSNTYVGDTTIQVGGKLLMNGEISHRPTTSYGYLGGSGTFGGEITVSSGTLAPGGLSLGGGVIDSIAALTTLSSLSLSGSATTQLAITGSTSDLYDRINCDSLLGYGGTLALTLSGDYVDQTMFSLFSGFTSHSGSFSAITLSAVGTDFDGQTFTGPDANGDWYTGRTVNQRELIFSQSTGTVSVVPEPSTYAMAIAGLACAGWQMFRRRRLKVA
jgi:autotransporter-associated beta strand protein